MGELRKREDRKIWQLTIEQNNHEAVCFAVHCILLIVLAMAAPLTT